MNTDEFFGIRQNISEYTLELLRNSRYLFIRNSHVRSYPTGYDTIVDEIVEQSRVYRGYEWLESYYNSINNDIAYESSIDTENGLIYPIAAHLPGLEIKRRIAIDIFRAIIPRIDASYDRYIKIESINNIIINSTLPNIVFPKLEKQYPDSLDIIEGYRDTMPKYVKILVKSMKSRGG